MRSRLRSKHANEEPEPQAAKRCEIDRKDQSASDDVGCESVNQRMDHAASNEHPRQYEVRARHKVGSPERQRDNVKEDRGLELIVQVGSNARCPASLSAGKRQFAIGRTPTNRIRKALKGQPGIEPEDQKQMRQNRPKDQHLWPGGRKQRVNQD